MLSKSLPRWTTPVKIESGGRYPLGLNRFHDGLEDFLIKGIIGAANRLRYISFCCWAIGDIEKSQKCEEYSEFVTAFTQRENALALGLHFLQPKYSIYGTITLKKIAKEEKREYDCSFKLMKSKDLGAYGLYYAGTIFNWGLIETDENGIIRLTKSGKKIYIIFDQYYNKIKPEYFLKYKGEKIVPKQTLLEWARVNDFDNIRLPIHTKERETYKSILS